MERKAPLEASGGDQASLHQSLSIYIAHEGPTINHSVVMWSSACGQYVSRLKEFEEECTKTSIYVCEKGVVDELLQRFCQRLKLPQLTNNTTHLATSILAQKLLLAYVPATDSFDPDKIGFGIKCMRTANRRRIGERLAKQYPQGADLIAWGEKTFANLNNGMVESHGLAYWSIMSFAQPGWACVFMLDVHSEQYKNEFERSGLPIAAVLCGACSTFYQAFEYITSQERNDEQSKLRYIIGRGVFEEETCLTRNDEVLAIKNSPIARMLRQNIGHATHDDPETETVNDEASSQDAIETPSPSVAPAKRKKKKKNRSRRRKHKSSSRSNVCDNQETEAWPHCQTNDVDLETESSPKSSSEENSSSTCLSLCGNKSCILQSERSHLPSDDPPSPPTTPAAKSEITVEVPQYWNIPQSMSEQTQFSSTGQPVFRFNVATLHMKCRMKTCFNLATSTNPTATICPRCGVYSYVRYCSPMHMHADMRRHFSELEPNQSLAECGNMAIPIAVDEFSIGYPVGPVRPFVYEHVLQGTQHYPRNILERHRQAVARSMDPINEYFIYDDIDRIPISHDVMSDSTPEVQMSYLQLVRGTGQVCATVSLPMTDPRKPGFNLTLDSCLSLGYAAGTIVPYKCSFLYDMIVEELSKDDLWDVQMCERLCVQMAFEFGYRVPNYKKMLRGDT